MNLDPAFSADPAASMSEPAPSGPAPVAAVSARLKVSLVRVAVGRWPALAYRLQLKLGHIVALDLADTTEGRKLVREHITQLLPADADRDHLLRALAGLPVLR